MDLMGAIWDWTILSRQNCLLSRQNCLLSRQNCLLSRQNKIDGCFFLEHYFFLSFWCCSECGIKTICTSLRFSKTFFALFFFIIIFSSCFNKIEPFQEWYMVSYNKRHWFPSMLVFANSSKIQLCEIYLFDQ